MRSITRVLSATVSGALGATALALASGPAQAVPPPVTIGGAGSLVVSAGSDWSVLSTATSLVPSDTNGKRDVYVRNNATGAYMIVSDPDGAGPQQSNGDSDAQHAFRLSLGISVDGRFVVFDSQASNLVPGDTNGKDDVFRWDRKTKTLSVVSAKAGFPNQVSNGASRFPSISGDGRYVSFQSDASNLVLPLPAGRQAGVNDLQVLIRDVWAKKSDYVSMRPNGSFPNSFSERADISADGNTVVFESMATNIDPDDTNGVADVFLHRRLADTTGVVSKKDSSVGGGIATDASYSPRVSGNGRYVVFESDGKLSSSDNNSVRDVFRRDTALMRTLLVSVQSNGVPFTLGDSKLPDISADGGRVVFQNDDPQFPMVFRRDLGSAFSVLVKSEAELPSVAGNGYRVGMGYPFGQNPKDGLLITLTDWSYLTKPTITFSGAFAIVADAKSGIAQVVVNGVRKRPGAGGKVAVASGQTITVWNGAGRALTKTRP